MHLNFRGFHDTCGDLVFMFPARKPSGSGDTADSPMDKMIKGSGKNARLVLVCKGASEGFVPGEGLLLQKCSGIIKICNQCVPKVPVTMRACLPLRKAYSPGGKKYSTR